MSGRFESENLANGELAEMRREINRAEARIVDAE
jgi:hypothetical protein